MRPSKPTKFEFEQTALNEIIRLKIREAITDPRPDIPANEVFEGLRARQDIGKTST